MGFGRVSGLSIHSQIQINSFPEKKNDVVLDSFVLQVQAVFSARRGISDGMSAKAEMSRFNLTKASLRRLEPLVTTNAKPRS